MITSSIQGTTEIEFAEAIQYWQLEKLYLDLAEAKGKGLTPLEKKFLQGLLCGYSPGEIAERVYKNRSSSSVRVYLSNGIYKYFQQLLLSKLGESIQINNWRRVTYLLEKAGYRKQNSWPTSSIISPISLADMIVFWEEKPEISNFIGREPELTQLQQWILAHNCRLVTVFGSNGIGKTSLVVKLIEQIQDQFEIVIWRSLGDTPNLCDLIRDLIMTISQVKPADLPLNMNPLSYLIGLLRSRRCLLVLNQFEQVFSSGELCGQYQQGYEEYAELLRRLGEEQHLSCCVLTSREEPPSLNFDAYSSIQRLDLGGLTTEQSEHLLKHYALIGSPSEFSQLVSICVNNTLVLTKIALVINRYFDGKIADFLTADTLLFPEIRTWLDAQFNRLSPLEQYVMYWLAVNRQLSANKRGNLALELDYQQELAVFASLKGRSLITSTLNLREPFWKAYLVEKLLNRDNISDNMPLNKIINQILQHTLAFS